ncbi:IclR family transcriptional regulator [Halorubrum sp. GN11_10-6_MGM]|uniref:IclR family transcriptional regulator n=1 Tax=Halorubrum sp. GN11_10-6_MGM TaxID=2518112 RepID=UPI0010F4B73F|nr:IclR family transcriptional regulator [Halorubrum sp. GN11_10-6_MGM]TKX73885.1 IclR family transcriptional regulator [Halorubrum sp. GN11_10-6_MGM]
MSQQSESRETVQAVETAFDILDEIRSQNNVTLSDLADDLSLAKSTVHRHLRTLNDRHYITHKEGEFELSFELLALGEAARRKDETYALAEEKVEELARKTGERAQFVVEEDGVGFCVFRATGEHAVETDPQVGSQMPLHATASGKSILAFLPTHRIKELLDESLPVETPNTITDRDTLREELDSVREQGYAVNHCEHIEGLTAFGAPVRRSDGGVIGAISISGPERRFEDADIEEEVRSRLLGTTNELELNITHSQ